MNYKLEKYTESSGMSKIIFDNDDFDTYYSDGSVPSCGLFKGDYINFGYWSCGANDAIISESQRVLASERLYGFVFRHMAPASDDNILEIGSGRGVGARLLCESYNVRSIVGIDSNVDQVHFSQKKYQDVERGIIFQFGDAYDLPFEDKLFGKVFSIEVLQHLKTPRLFFHQIGKVLSRNGVFIFATFFAKDANAIPVIESAIPTVRDGIDNLHSIAEIKKQLLEEDFIIDEVIDIGEHVWFGFDRWIRQTKFKDSWNTNWYRLYQDGLISYYVVKCFLRK